MYNQDYTSYQMKRSRLRKFIRRIYLKHTLNYVRGKAIDFGCGVGELLARLPSGSLGYEINEATVRYCRETGLNVVQYSPEADRYQFNQLRAGEYKTFIMADVLEHLENAHVVLQRILHSCRRLGIERIIIMVPGPKGFRHDKTHKTFIDYEYLVRHNLVNDASGYSISKKRYFPMNCPAAGDYFTHNKLVVILDAKRQNAKQ